MKKLILLFLVVMCFSAEGKNIRILLTYGGHKFEEQAFFELFDSLPGITYTRMPLPESLDKLKPKLAKKYDVIVMYDMMKFPSTKQQRQAFAKLLGSGIGVVSLHHNIGAWKDWDEYVFVLGGKYIFEPETIDGRKYMKTKARHGKELEIQIADASHPVTRGINPFRIHDEAYCGYYVSPAVHLLLTTTHEENNKEIAWTTSYEKSPVCYIQLGHDSKAWKNPTYPKLLENAIRWAAKESRKIKR